MHSECSFSIILYLRSKFSNSHQHSTFCLTGTASITFIVYTLINKLKPRFDHWQLWHILGKPFELALVNAFGNNITKLVRETLLRNPKHGAFIDSCIHHCTKCSTVDEMWHGKIKSTAEKFTEAEAFRFWYMDSKGEKSMTFFQDGDYPCHDCCQCRIWKGT